MNINNLVMDYDKIYLRPLRALRVLPFLDFLDFLDFLAAVLRLRRLPPPVGASVWGTITDGSKMTAVKSLAPIFCTLTSV